MANTFNTGVHREDWETKLQDRLDKPISWKEVCDVVYSDNYIINWPYMSTEFAVQSGTRGTAFGYADFALTNDTVTVSAHEIVPIYIDRADMAQIQYLRQMELAERQAAAINERLEALFLATHGSWTNVGDSAGVVTSGVTTQITVSATNIDDIIRGARRIITAANGLELMNRNGLAFVWRATDFEYLEQFAQANGFQLADKALQSGVPNAYYFMGAYHYVSNSHTANHVFAGVRKIVRLGLLRSTWGKIRIIESPSNSDGNLSGTGIEARFDYGFQVPAGLATTVLDINVA